MIYIMKKKPDQEEKTLKDTFIREIETYKYELIVMAILTFNTGTIVFFEMFGIVKGFSWIAGIVLLAGMWALFAWKNTIYLPRGKRVMTFRFGQDGGVTFGTTPIKDRMIPFDNTPESQKVQITGVRKHWHRGSGRPIVVMVEDWPENVNVTKNYKPTMQSRDFSSILTNSYQTGYDTGRNSILKQGAGILTPNMMVVIMLIALGVIGFLVFMQMGMLEEIGRHVGVEFKGLL